MINFVRSINLHKTVHLCSMACPPHEKAYVKQYVAATNGRPILHFLPGYAPGLDPDELMWSHLKRTGTARLPLHKGESLRQRIEDPLEKLRRLPKLVRSFFQASSVACIGDY